MERQLWEYDVRIIDHTEVRANLDEALHSLGQGGWEVFHVVARDVGRVQLWSKRPTDHVASRKW